MAAASDTSFDLQNNSEFSNSDHFNQPISNTTTEYKDAAQVICRLASGKTCFPKKKLQASRNRSRVRYQGKGTSFQGGYQSGEFDERAYYAGLGISMQLTDAVLTERAEIIPLTVISFMKSDAVRVISWKQFFRKRRHLWRRRCFLRKKRNRQGA